MLILSLDVLLVFYSMLLALGIHLLINLAQAAFLLCLFGAHPLALVLQTV